MATHPLNSELCRELGSNVESLTHSGTKVLDEEKVKRIKQICKLSNDYVKHAYHLLLYQLEKEHAEIRYSAFQICDVLFRRSHCFRELLVSDLQRIMELTAETNPDLPLPLPRSVAIELKRMVLKTIQLWNNDFGDGYKKLQLGFNFLKHCKKVDFNALEQENSAERLRQQALQNRQNALNSKKLKAVEKEICDMKPDIFDAVTGLENCISLILPSPENFFISEEKLGNTANSYSSEECISLSETELNKSKRSALEEEFQVHSDSEDETGQVDNLKTNFRANGLIGLDYSIQVQLNPAITVSETPENAAIFENARGFSRLIINRYLPAVKKWIHLITKASGNSEKLKEVLDIKKDIDTVLQKYSQINVTVLSQDDSDESHSDFEEVKEKDGYEDSVMDRTAYLKLAVESKRKHVVPKEKDSDWNISQETNVEDPTTVKPQQVKLKNHLKIQDKYNEDSNLRILNQNTKKSGVKTIQDTEPQPSTSNCNAEEKSRKERLLEVAPKLPFDIDLYHWEDENMTAPTMFCVKPDGARFWSATSTDELEEIPVPEGVSSLRTRVIEFSGSYEPVKWMCRAPLPSGKLCPRRDRQKCPFHGTIIPRDEKGEPANAVCIKKVESSDLSGEKVPDWQDPQLLEEIKAATGVDLKMPEKGKRSKKKESRKFPGLTDISAKQSTSITRLSKKIFKKSSVKRVAEAMDKLDHKRFRDKYGDQFNYMYETA